MKIGDRVWIHNRKAPFVNYEVEVTHVLPSGAVIVRLEPDSELSVAFRAGETLSRFGHFAWGAVTKPGATLPYDKPNSAESAPRTEHEQ